jgi:hypothetical protein
MAEAMPSSEASLRDRAIYSTVLTNVTWEHVKLSLQADDECVFFSLAEHGLKGWNIKGTKWADATNVPGTQVRRIQFRYKLPTDVPDVIKRLVNVADDSLMNNLYRLGITDQKAMVLQEIQTVDAPFGTNFWASEILTFSPQPGGVKFDKWCTVRWVTSLPWYASPVRGVVEQNCIDGAKGSGAALAELLQQGIQ